MALPQANLGHGEGLDHTSLGNRSPVFKEHLSLWKQSCQAIFSFTIFTAVSLSYANEAADEAFLQGGPRWEQLHRGDLLPAWASRQGPG